MNRDYVIALVFIVAAAICAYTTLGTYADGLTSHAWLSAVATLVTLAAAIVYFFRARR